MKKKLIITGIVLAVIGLAVLFDFYRSTLYTIKVISIAPQPGIADGRSPVTMKTQILNKANKPMKGHDLYAVSLAGGNFRANRVRTNAEGIAEFVYYPFLASSIEPAKDVPIEIRDESNSIFIEINTVGNAVIKLVQPTGKGSKSEYDLNDIFGEDDKKKDNKEGE